ncbi:tyrosine-protein kinase receptor Tie-1-like [Ptychodera flava]|uniref:tyrosine-protein kinase receptor Tie-1-like n=1 Tax=Ptychodera flava TaxID=63121 RepID=UPI00396A0E06
MYVLQCWLILCLTVSLTGARLDVTFFSQKATPSLNGNLFIAGFSTSDAISTVGTSFIFDRILDTGTGSGLPAGSSQRDFNVYSRRLNLPPGAGRPGAYYCAANANTGGTERLQTVLIVQEAEIKPEIQTKTVSWGDDTTMTMATSVSASSLKWRHNGVEQPQWNGQNSITISFTKPSDAGIYECYSSETQRTQGKHGFMRLIVRVCPNGKWGLPDCLFSCPTCYNGGMCNSDTGECICPPGFQGSNCETGCGKNNWGMTCERRCSSSNPDACRSTMYCLADPYGCSCSASYGGIDCATNCPNGKYGAGCTQTCHCVNGCDGATGECNSGGCLQGWSGSKCHIPVSCHDGFYGELCNYKCHCKDNAACDKVTGMCSNGECAPGWINVFADCQQDGSLQIQALYNVKVNPGEQTSIICKVVGNPPASPDDVSLVDQSGSAVIHTDHYFIGMYLFISNYSTATADNGLPYTCRAGDQSKELTTFETYVLPELSPINRPELSPRATRVTVTWKKWENGTDLGDGPVEAYKVYFKKTADSDWTANQHFQVEDPDQASYTTDITSLDWCTSYDFTVTVKRPGLRGEGSKDTYSTVSTLCDVPDSCPVGFYGELCNYKCHCKDNAACDKLTGMCSNGECAPGWINVFADCQQDGSLRIQALYNVKVNPGEQTSIICEVIGNPPASPNDVSLVDQSGSAVTHTDHYFRGMYLSISNYSTATVDNGLPYTCRVGDQSKELTIFETNVLPELSPIDRPELSPRATRVTVTWKKWENGTDLGDGPVEAYKVYFKKTADSDWTANQHFQVEDPDQKSYTTDITGLDWCTSYNFTVTVKRPGPKGEGSKDTCSTVSTLCEEGPTIAGTTSNYPNALQVSWVVLVSCCLHIMSLRNCKISI